MMTLQAHVRPDGRIDLLCPRCGQWALVTDMEAEVDQVIRLGATCPHGHYVRSEGYFETTEAPE